MTLPALPSADFTRWPLVLLDAGDVTASWARDAILALVGEALDREGPFTAAVDMSRVRPDDDAREDATRTADQARAVKGLRPLLAGRCRGLAFAVAAEALPSPAPEPAVSRFWGCPVAMVAAWPQALALAGEWAEPTETG